MDVTLTTAPNGRIFYGQPYPLVLQCDSPDASLADACAWAHANRTGLDHKAAESGVVLLRGFSLRTDQDFDAFVSRSDSRTSPTRNRFQTPCA